MHIVLSYFAKKTCQFCIMLLGLLIQFSNNLIIYIHKHILKEEMATLNNNTSVLIHSY